MRSSERNQHWEFNSFEQFENSSSSGGANDWAVPWSDLMMVMFVLFVVLFVYASSHQDVKVLFSDQAADEAKAASSLDPLVGLIGQIASTVDSGGSQDFVRVAQNKVLYRSRADGVSILRESSGRVRITLRGDLFFAEKDGGLSPDSGEYLTEIAELVRLSAGTVHVIGYADVNESVGVDSFALSTDRAASVATFLIDSFDIDPKRVVITGRGAYHPELPETSEANQARNRRVEVVIMNER